MLWINHDHGAVLSCLALTEWMNPLPWLVLWRWPGLLHWRFPSALRRDTWSCWAAPWWDSVGPHEYQTGCCWQRELTRPPPEGKGWNHKKKQSQHASVFLPRSGPTTSEPQCVRRKVFPSWWSCCALTLTRWSEQWPSPCATCPSTAATRTWLVQTLLTPQTHQMSPWCP